MTAAVQLGLIAGSTAHGSAKSARSASPPRQDEPDLPLFEFTSRVVGDLDELAALEPAWQRLADVALESNSFYEPWCLLPALRHLPAGERPEVLVVEAPKRVFPEGPRVLCGLFPVVRRRSFYGLPVKCWELWRHVHCYLNTPLVRRDCARETYEYFVQAAALEGAKVVYLPQQAADGAWRKVLVEANAAAGRTVFVKDETARAEFRRDVDVESFLKASLSRKKRQGIQRIERRLAELGSLSTAWLTPADDAAAWAEAFLRLEASGWKGSNGTALAHHDGEAAFFRELVDRASAAGRLLFGRLDFDGRPLAMICNLLAGDGGYSFKIAYDEAFAEHSPGLLLELALIRELHARGVDWMDSCAASDHPMINHLWPERTIRQSLVVSTGRRGGDWAAATMPLLRWFKNRFRKTSAE